jgi:hypothetical protein
MKSKTKSYPKNLLIGLGALLAGLVLSLTGGGSSLVGAAVTPTYQWHTFYGSNQNDQGYGLTLDGPRTLVAVGASNASWLGDGDTGPRQAYSGQYDVLVLRLRQEALLYLPLILKN